MWREALASCESAWQASVEWASREHLPREKRDYHSLNWRVEIAFELGQRRTADAALATFAEDVRAGLGPSQRGLYAWQVLSYLARTGDASQVETLLAPLSAPATTRADPGGGVSCHGGQAPAPPWEALEQLATTSARTFAAAMRHDVAGTSRGVAEMEGLRKQTRVYAEGVDGPAAYAKERQVQGLIAKAWVAMARKSDRDLVAALRKAAAVEDSFPAGEGTASGTLTHEQLGDALLRTGDAQAARKEYELVVRKHAGRAHALLGAARAAAKAGDTAGARGFYARLLEVWASADPDFPGVAEAKQALASASL
jgi:hypothetical protein